MIAEVALSAGKAGLVAGLDHHIDFQLAGTGGTASAPPLMPEKISAGDDADVRQPAAQAADQQIGEPEQPVGDLLAFMMLAAG
jgi:hypothetical protein